MRVITVNVNGLRAAQRKGLYDWLASQQPDVVCIQELKAQLDQLPPATFIPQGYHAFFHAAEKKGYSGVAVLCRQTPLQVQYGLGWEDVDSEGRYLAVDLPGGLKVVSLYLHSGSSSEQRQERKFDFMRRFKPVLQELRDSGQDVLVCGDWNIAHQEIDLKNWRANQKNSGFLPAERAWMGELIDQQGWCDVFRQLHPDDAGQYTWWSNRGRAWDNNVGWRIDYQMATPGLAARARQSWIYKDERFSDHAPLLADYADKT